MKSSGELRKEMMMAETSIRTNVSEICNLMLNGRVEDETPVINVLNTLTNCQKEVLACLKTLET